MRFVSRLLVALVLWAALVWAAEALAVAGPLRERHCNLDPVESDLAHGSLGIVAPVKVRLPGEDRWRIRRVHVR